MAKKKSVKYLVIIEKKINRYATNEKKLFHKC